MSYDLHLLLVPLGEDPLATLERELERQDVELNPGPARPEVEGRKRHWLAAVTRFDPDLKIALFDFEGLAALERTGEAEARRRYRHLELNSGNYAGIQITLWDDRAELTFPYWHSGEQAANVLRQVWDYLEVLQRAAGFVVVDPQLDRVLDLASDFPAVLRFYAGGENATSDQQARVPRWKLW